MWTATRTLGSPARSATSAPANSHVSCRITSGSHSATAAMTPGSAARA